MPSSPLLAATNASKHVDKSSSAADVPVPSVTTHQEHASSEDKTVVKPVQELPKPSNDDAGSKKTLAASVPSKLGSSLFTDDDADDLFASPAPSKVGFSACTHTLSYYNG